ncbi:molybdenum cofactor guanylyltransferase MobA [Rhizobium tubonense]|uniref:Molybdenum cofactor guanylyltransferase n=1 Tax=Rhizobium tubonense TaxID=484088 RepID=A0A2W4CK91_9HYPH|nr:molybdenum cofactor guanylyltransferase MobA [Rhizobium tubonense]PZM13071.1 molybdenum cofactor guanylyltransferase MobA [Rhizobium tubonense]
MSVLKIDPKTIPGVILAGGRSSRMGRNKAIADLGGESLLARIKARISPQVSALALNADPDWPEALGLRLIPDTIPGKAGPLAGVLAALRDTAASHPQATYVVTVPIDSPFLPEDLVSSLAASLDGAQAIAIATSQDRDHPVFGLWPVAIADELENWLLADEKRRMRDFLARHTVRRVEFEMIETTHGALDPFFNVNTPDDLKEAEQWLQVLPR